MSQYHFIYSNHILPCFRDITVRLVYVCETKYKHQQSSRMVMAL